jgi:hypothetical protein
MAYESCGIDAGAAAVFNNKTTWWELGQRSAQFSCECGVICGVDFWVWERRFKNFEKSLENRIPTTVPSSRA